jgi:Sigma-70 region 2
MVLDLPSISGVYDGGRWHRGVMNTSESEDEITVKLLAAAATDEILVAATKLGDRPAFAELWARQSKRSLQIAYRITKNREDAEDVLQEAWTKAYVHLKSFDGKAKFSTWLTHIAINTALMTLRRKRLSPDTFAEFMACNCATYKVGEHPRLCQILSERSGSRSAQSGGLRIFWMQRGSLQRSAMKPQR